jgi:cholesterol oxidase
MLPLLTMGRDVPGGQLSLDGSSSLSLDWNPADSEDYFSRAETTAAAVAARLGGSLGPRLLRRRTRGVTVHPLGGCPMASDRSHGVVDSSGEVYGYRGLFVADGSVMPGPVGPNPSLTIAAMADHIATAAAIQLCDANERRGV